MEKKAGRCLFCETKLDEKDEYCPYCGIEAGPKHDNNGGSGKTQLLRNSFEFLAPRKVVS